MSVQPGTKLVMLWQGIRKRAGSSTWCVRLSFRRLGRREAAGLLHRTGSCEKTCASERKGTTSRTKGERTSRRWEFEKAHICSGNLPLTRVSPTAPPPSLQPFTRHTLNCLVQNEPGVLSRVSGILAARGFNIDSLVVCATEIEDLSRMCIVLRGQDGVIEQARRQLEDLVRSYSPSSNRNGGS